MLNFLHPWLWLGLIAVGAPLWLHLRRKEREDIVRFSALRFLEDQPIARQSPLHLRNLLLFLLRLLAVVALVAAFVQPYLAQPRAADSSSEVYILDNTLSRQAEDGLNHDRALLIGALRRAGPHDQIAVVELSGEPRVVVDFGDSPATAEGKLNVLQPTAKRGAMVSALREATLLLRRSLGGRKHITILTDSQKNEWLENSGTPPFLAPDSVSLAPTSGLDSRPNFFVGNPRLQRIFLGDHAVVQFTGQVGHSGKVNTATLRLNVNGQKIIEQGTRLDDRTDQISVATQWDCDPSTWLVGSIQVSAQPDDLPQDDTAYFTLPPVTEGRVALLTNSLYLKTALSAGVARGHWSAEILQPASLSSLPAAGDPDADVLMVDADYLQANQGRALVDRYVKSGRGVFIMMGRASPLLNGFLQEIGFRPELQLPSDMAAPLLPIRYFAPESPVFRPFTIPDFSNLLEVRIANPVHLQAVNAKPLLFSQSGDGLLFDVPRDRGRILLSAFAFDRSQTDWVVHPSFVPFLDAALQYLRPQAQLNETLEPGEIWAAPIPPAAASAQIGFLRDLRGHVMDQAPVDQQHRRVTLHAPDQPGVYALTYDNDTAIRQMLSVNPSLQESDLRYLTGTPDILKTWTLPVSALAPEAKATAVLPVPAQAARQILWWGLLLAGSLALCIEMIWLAQAGRGA